MLGSGRGANGNEDHHNRGGPAAGLIRIRRGQAATPEYSRAAETKVTGKIAEVREAGTESALPGIYLTVNITCVER